MDNLSKCMIQCKKDGYGVHYGAWRAAQGDILVVEEGIPQGYAICQHCGKRFLLNKQRTKKYCDAICQNMASYYRCKQKKKEGTEDGQA